MNLLNFICFSLLIFLIPFVKPATAADKPVQVALFAPIQIFPENDTITGIRLNLLYGQNQSVTGLDLGMVNHLTGGVSKGIQFGIVGFNEADYIGWQDNAVNWTKGNFEGFQFGFVNYAQHMTGFQLGIVNYAVNAKGLQIGFLNIIKHGGQFSMFPIVNWSF